MKLAKDIIRIYRELLEVIDETRAKHADKDYFERLIDALDALGSAITRMRARGVIDPALYEEYEKVLMGATHK